MSKTINQRELRNAFAKVLREVQAGQTIIVTRNGEPVAELRPVRSHRFVPRAAIAEAAARAPRIDARRFRADSAVTLAELAAGPHATRDQEERARRQDRLQWAAATWDPLPFDTCNPADFAALNKLVKVIAL